MGAGRAHAATLPPLHSHAASLPAGTLQTCSFYLLLQPLNPATSRCRLLVVGKKRLPSTTSHERFFTFVGEGARAACSGSTHTN